MFLYVLTLTLFVATQAQNISHPDGLILAITSYPLCQGVEPLMNESDLYCFSGGRASILCRRPEPSCESGQKVATGFILGYRDGGFIDHNANCTYYHWIWSCAHDWRVCLNGTVCVCNETTADPAHPESLCNCSSSHDYETNTCTNSPTVAPTFAPTTSPTPAPTGTPTLSPTDVPTASPTSVPTVSPTTISSLDASPQARPADSNSSGDTMYGLDSETLFWIVIGLGAGLLIIIIVVAFVTVTKNRNNRKFAHEQYISAHVRTTPDGFDNPVYSDVNASSA